jgi:glycerol-3-phosphate cytidylyltransferase-like family protein
VAQNPFHSLYPAREICDYLNLAGESAKQAREKRPHLEWHTRDQRYNMLTYLAHVQSIVASEQREAMEKEAKEWFQDHEVEKGEFVTRRMRMIMDAVFPPKK